MFISSVQTLILFSLVLISINSFIIPFLFDKNRKKRDFIIILISFCFSFLVYHLISLSQYAEDNSYVLGRISEGLNFAFKVTKRSYPVLLILVALYPISILYTLKYMEVLNNQRQSVFLGCFSFSILCTFGIAISENLLTLFIFYELLTISTYPLVSYYRNKETSINSKIYIYTLLATSMVMFMSAIIILYQKTGTLSFSENGILDDDLLDKKYINILVFMFIFGCAKLPTVPVYFWLPSAMVAPTPVSALLHAVAVVKSGAFTVLSILYYIFGAKMLSVNLYQYGGYNWISIIASITIVISSINAINNDMIKKKLAYSTIANLSYITLIASLFQESSLKVALFYIIPHALAKINLFFISGIVKIKINTYKLSEMKSIFHEMPLTCVNLIISIFSLCGLPFTIGFWAKKNIIFELSSGSYFFLALVFLFGILSSLVYYYSIIYRLVIKELNIKNIKFDSINLFLLIPTTLISVVIILSFIYYHNIVEFLC